MASSGGAPPKTRSRADGVSFSVRPITFFGGFYLFFLLLPSYASLPLSLFSLVKRHFPEQKNDSQPLFWVVRAEVEVQGSANGGKLVYLGEPSAWHFGPFSESWATIYD